MNKKILTQIKNEWQSNLWLFIELLLVSVVMWYVVDYMYVKTAIYNLPRGFDITNCYELSMGNLTDQTPGFISGRPTGAESDDIKEIVERLRHRSDIEAVGLGQNAYPYNGSNSTTSLRYDTLFTSIFRRLVTPGFLEVFRYQGANGETSAMLAEQLSEEVFLVSDDVFQSEYKKSVRDMVDKSFYLYGDTSRTYRLAAAYQPVRYDDFMEAQESQSMFGLLTWIDTGIELCIRVKEGQDIGFADRLRADLDKQYRVGNVFISDIRSFKDIRNSFQERQMSQLRNYLFGMIFLLLNIFIALLGTFWFRTQQRRGEIALHKSFGATPGHILIRQISEGLLLLTIATIPAVIIDYNLARAEVNQMMNQTTFAAGRFFLTVLYTYLIMAVMIIIGIVIPASKAMRLNAAEALHNE